MVYYARSYRVPVELVEAIIDEEDAIARVYKRCSIRYSNPIPTFNDLREELANWLDAEKMQRTIDEAHLAAIKLRSWTEGGIYAKLFDRPTTMRLDSDWLFFNVEGLSSDPRLETAMSMLIATVAVSPSWTLVLLAALLAPILEESLFRGCVFPLLATKTGNAVAIAVTAGIFALFHRPADLVHWISFGLTGIAYGSIRAISGSTTGPAIAHSAYNLILLFAALTGRYSS